MQDNQDPKGASRRRNTPRTFAEALSSKYHRKALHDYGSTTEFRTIGSGACGIIFAQRGVCRVYKKASHINDDLWNDCAVHRKVQDVFRTDRKHRQVAEVPQCYEFINETNEVWWKDHLPLFPTDQRVPSKVLVSEPIPPVSPTIRAALIEKYCSPTLQGRAVDDGANADCLIRLYLGAKRPDPGTRLSQFFTLRTSSSALTRWENCIWTWKASPSPWPKRSPFYTGLSR